MKYDARFQNRFNKKYKKYLKQDKKLKDDFKCLLEFITEGLPLPVKYRDHKLKANLEGLHDCHLRYDLVIIRYYIKDDIVVFSDIGSHKEIFGN